MDKRFVNYLKEKSRVTGSLLINLSHQQIADELGTNRVVVSRLLNQLENDKKLSPLSQPGQIAEGIVTFVSENCNVCYRENSSYHSIFVM